MMEIWIILREIIVDMMRFIRMMEQVVSQNKKLHIMGTELFH